MKNAHRHGTAPWFNAQAAADTLTVHLYDHIGGWFGVDASELVQLIDTHQGSRIDMYVNSPGGDVYDAIAIRSALSRSKAHVTATVDGLAASAASYVLHGADEIVMSPNAELMIHDAWTAVAGDAADLRAYADNLDRVSDNIASMYAASAGGTPEQWRQIMKAETWYSAQEAVDAGLAHRIAENAPAAEASFDLSAYAYQGRAKAPDPVPVAEVEVPKPEPSPANAEAAKWRKKLRDAESEIGALRSQLAKVQADDLRAALQSAL